jgi:soluble lytic murein transglycosylase
MAVKAFNSIPLENQPDDFIWRLLLKTGKAYFKANHFREAEETLTGLLAKNPRQGIAEEAWYWLARSLDKIGRKEESVTIYVKLAENAPCLTLGDDALLAAAFIRKNQNKIDDELMFLKKLVQSYPQSNLCQTAFWEIAWTSYQEGDMKTASEHFKKLLENDETRERALYWYGRTLLALKDDKGAANAFASLLGEFPHGFYAFLYKKETMTKEDDSFHISAQICNMIPVPAGFDRTKALIALGLNEEAAIELAASKRKLGDKTTTLAGLARLYLQMGDYHGAYSLFRDVRLHNPDRNTLVEWGIAYPLAYREEVEDVAAKYEVPESLIFAIIRAESSYYPKALSPCGAVGLMQLMPATAAAIGKGNFSRDQLTIPRSNISLGVRHLHDLLTLYDGDIVLTVAAYNAGSGNVYRWRKLFGNMSMEQFIENIPFTETREYVKKVLAAAEIYGSLYKLAPLPDRGWSKTYTVPRDAGPSPLPSAEPIKTSVRAASKPQ